MHVMEACLIEHIITLRILEQLLNKTILIRELLDLVRNQGIKELILLQGNIILQKILVEIRQMISNRLFKNLLYLYRQMLEIGFLTNQEYFQIVKKSSLTLYYWLVILKKGFGSLKIHLEQIGECKGTSILLLEILVVQKLQLWELVFEKFKY